MTTQIKHNLKRWNACRMTALALALSLLLSACGGSDSATSMRLKKMLGDVRVNDDKDKDVKAKVDLGLYSGYAVNTETESYAWVDLDSVKLAKLDQSSKIAIEKDGGNLTINVKNGNLFFDIAEPLKDDENLTIRTSTLAIGIRGTNGWVEVPEEGEMMRVCLLEGKVECTAGDQTAMVKAGEMATMTKDGTITVEKLPDGAIPAFVQEELDNGTAESGGPVFVPWEEAGMTDHAMEWRDEKLAKKMAEVTGISDREIMLSDVWAETSLELDEAGIRDISALGELTNLTRLSLDNNQISDFDALVNLTNLTHLSLDYNKISDISFLGEMPVTTALDSVFSEADDFGFIEELTDMSWLRSMIAQIRHLGKIMDLAVSGSLSKQESDTSSLKGLANLKSLSMAENQINDISALKNLPNLTELDLSGNPISDTSVLDGQPNLTIRY